MKINTFSYNDTKLRPWNIKNTQDRRDGEYYKDYFEHVKRERFISITSFNEWGEGTQIEPVAEKVCLCKVIILGRLSILL